MKYVSVLANLFRASVIFGPFFTSGCFAQDLPENFVEPPAEIPAGVPKLGYRIVREFPLDPKNFVQGFEVWEAEASSGVQFLVSSGLYGESFIGVWDPVENRWTMRRAVAKSLFAEGATRVGDEVLQISWQSGTLIRWNAEALSLVDMQYYEGEGWGLDYDGDLLLRTDGSDRLLWHKTDDFSKVRDLTVRWRSGGSSLFWLNELEYDERGVWANVWQRDYIVLVEPESGTVQAALDLAGLAAGVRERHPAAEALNGVALAADGRIFVTGKLWDRIFELELTFP